MRFWIGRSTWLSDFTYISNLVDVLLLADEALAKDGVNSIAAGQAYFTTNGEPTPFWDVVKKVAARLGLPPVRYAIPYQPLYAMAAIREWLDALRGGEVMTDAGLTRFGIRYLVTHHYYSIDKARRDLGYDRAVSLDEGIELTCRHLEETGFQAK